MWNAKSTGGYSSTSQEGRENANEMASTFLSVGFSIDAVSAMLGNSAGEGGLNPWRWESDYVPTYSEYLSWSGQTAMVHGYGLFGFTPARSYIEAAKSIDGYAPNFSDKAGNPSDGQSQTIFMTTYVEQNWSHSLHNYYADNFAAIGVNIDDFYYMTYDDFKNGNASLDNLTGAFELCFEKPNDAAAASSYAHRVSEAYKWYEYFEGHPPTPHPIKRKGMPIWMMIRPYW